MGEHPARVTIAEGFVSSPLLRILSNPLYAVNTKGKLGLEELLELMHEEP